MCVAKTKAMISFAVTAKLICVFVFAYADCWFSHEAVQIVCDFDVQFTSHFARGAVCLHAVVVWKRHWSALIGMCAY